MIFHFILNLITNNNIFKNWLGATFTNQTPLTIQNTFINYGTIFSDSILTVKSYHIFKNYNKVTSIVKKLNIDLVDIRKVFDNENNPKIFFPFQQFAWHYNEDGYKKVAEAIYNLTKG